ncbi:TetR/AcrR family transcriptional regulator [Prauserella cavernicola]|uniref:TetR/AcrR family transcriptional regulator C-terminal domain-containing protein n=1 Tax=Prauserella cavernicola TaxID=2800127 RepID=A0A934V2S9_9PSEU|nr:TetR/AcrR family transcriptional regulator [Prauserella cavernicola]MBK1782769.1 TetR/AcrR family transcriptional regulator C-terminal domain-containing protein [Prauserella cavernicola]
MTTDPRKRLELLWNGAQRPSRGPKPKLTLDQIATTAIAIADADGLDGLSMQRLAAELGYTTMSLYRYVPGKDQLVEVMLDRAAGDPPRFTGEVRDWRDEIQVWVRELWAVYLRHPWSLRVQVSGPPSGPGQLAWFEAALRPLAHAGLADDELVATVMFLMGAVRQMALLEIDISGARAQSNVTTEEAQTGYETTLREFVDPQRFPTLTALVGRGGFAASGDSGEGIDLDLDFGVQRVLDGLESYLAAQQN